MNQEAVPKRFLTYGFLFAAIGLTLYLALFFQQRRMLYSSTAAIWFSAACSGALFLSSFGKKGNLDRSISIISFLFPVLLTILGYYSTFLFYSTLLMITAGRAFYVHREALSGRSILYPLALTALLGSGSWIFQAYLAVIAEGTLHLSVLRQIGYLFLLLGVFYLILLMSTLAWRILQAFRALITSNVPAS